MKSLRCVVDNGDGGLRTAIHGYDIPDTRVECD